MKKILFAVFLLVFVLSVSISAADPVVLAYKTCGTSKGVEDLFEGDYFSLDLFINLDSLKAYFIETNWDGEKAYTMTYPADVKSKVGDNQLYFVLENGTIIKGHNDDNGYDFWVDYNAGSVKLYAADEFNRFSDYMKVR